MAEYTETMEVTVHLALHVPKGWQMRLLAIVCRVFRIPVAVRPMTRTGEIFAAMGPLPVVDDHG